MIPRLNIFKPLVVGLALTTGWSVSGCSSNKNDEKAKENVVFVRDNGAFTEQEVKQLRDLLKENEEKLSRAEKKSGGLEGELIDTTNALKGSRAEVIELRAKANELEKLAKELNVYKTPTNELLAEVIKLSKALNSQAEILESNRRKIIVNNSLKSTVSLSFERPGEKDAVASGFILVENGRRFIFTADHSFNQKNFKNRAVTVELSNKESFTLLPSKLEKEGLLFKKFPESDFAIIEIPPEQKLSENVGFKLAGELPLLGEPVIGIGSPYGYKFSVNYGNVSGLKRDIRMPNGVLLKGLIQLSNGINPGNSGGPIINIDGEVIAMVIALRENAQGIAFAVSASEIKKHFNKALEEENLKKRKINPTIDLNKSRSSLHQYMGELSHSREMLLPQYRWNQWLSQKKQEINYRIAG